MDDIPYDVLLSMENRITQLERAVIELQDIIRVVTKQSEEAEG